ncbi:MAG: MBL fold metallo-hydrolase [Gemmatimonadales bacterium]
MPIHRHVLIALILAGAALRVDAQGAAAPATFTFRELAPGVLAAEVVPRPPHYAFANSLVVDLGDGLLVVDTQQSPDAARALIGELRNRWAVPVRWVVNTHWHGDHVLGNSAYRDAWPDVRLIGHMSHPEDIATRTREQVERDLATLPAGIAQAEEWLQTGNGPSGNPLTETQRTSLRRSLSMRQAQLAMLRDVRLVPPDELVADSLTIRGTTRSVQILAMGPAHTRGDIIVWLPEERTLAAGDLVEDAWPWLDGADITGWRVALDRILALRPRLVLPSHGTLWQAPVPRLQSQQALFAAAERASCAVGGAVPPPPRELDRFATTLILPPSNATAFWQSLVRAARATASCAGGQP